MNRSVNRRLLRGQLELLKLLLIDIGIGEDSTIHELIPETMGYRGDVTYDNSKLDGTLRKLMCVGLINSIGWKPRTVPAAGWHLPTTSSRQRKGQRVPLESFHPAALCIQPINLPPVGP